MKTIRFRLAEPERDFGQLAAFFLLLEDWPNSEQSLKEFYAKEQQRIIQRVAEDENGVMLGFFWAEKDRSNMEKVYFYLFVQPELREQGLGSGLYEEMIGSFEAGTVKRLQASTWDNSHAGKNFLNRRGFSEKLHQIAMKLDLNTFNEEPYLETITKLKSEGFRFTSMGELGNTEEAQRKLYLLNNATSRDVPGTDGEAPWDSFEDFQKRVCQSEWYKPDGQMVVVDTITGAWAGMSAITRLEGTDYAYNLHTGVDRHYRGHKLGQAVKVTALRFARDVLHVDTVRTHHNTKNLPMLAIDYKLGYTLLPGTFLMEKIL
jgi:GNAT superfamily N-acetyltransferase